MSIDNGAAYQQPHSCSAGFGSVESLEDALQMRRIDALPRIAHGHENVCAVLLCADQQLSCSRLDRAHCFNRVEDQVQQDLLQLNAIPMNGKRPLRGPSLDRDAIVGGCASRQFDHLVDRLTQVETLLS